MRIIESGVERVGKEIGEILNREFYHGAGQVLRPAGQIGGKTVRLPLMTTGTPGREGRQREHRQNLQGRPERV